MSETSVTAYTKEEYSMADVNDSSCGTEFNKTVLLDSGSDDCCTQDFTYRVIEVKPEDLQDVKQEPVDEYDNEVIQSCENVPLGVESDDYCFERAACHTKSHDYCMHQDEVVLLQLEEVKQESADEDDEDQHNSKNV